MLEVVALGGGEGCRVLVFISPFCHFKSLCSKKIFFIKM